MILPHPESDLSLNIFVIGSEILQVLRKNKNYVLVENILSTFLRKDKSRLPDLCIDALAFLFTLGLIEYKGY